MHSGIKASLLNQELNPFIIFSVVLLRPNVIKKFFFHIIDTPQG